MTAPRDSDSIISAWLDEGPDRLPESTRRAIEVTTRTIRQSRRPNWLPWRLPNVNGMTRFALAAAAVVAVAVGGLYFLNRAANGPSNAGGQPTPTAPPTPTASPVPSPTAGLLDTTDWPTYESARYGFSIGRPADWTERPAERDWTLEADATDWLSPAQEGFVGPLGDVRLGAWSVAVAPGTSADAWIQTFCEASVAPGTDCSGFQDGAIPISVDTHPGVLITKPGFDHPAFILYGDRMYVIAVMREESDPSVMPYGGARRLLESFMSTMVLEAPAAPSAPPS
jgi:hypothetical protein